MTKVRGRIERFSQFAVAWSGSAWAFGAALALIVLWLVAGPICGYSDAWQLSINTGTTIITFLMVFLIQRAQNKESLSVQLKLNEIVAALQGASNRLINVEDLSEEEVRKLHEDYETLVRRAQKPAAMQQSHSIEETAGRAK